METKELNGIECELYGCVEDFYSFNVIPDYSNSIVISTFDIDTNIKIVKYEPYNGVIGKQGYDIPDNYRYYLFFGFSDNGKPAYVWESTYIKINQPLYRVFINGVTDEEVYFEYSYAHAVALVEIFNHWVPTQPMSEIEDIFSELLFYEDRQLPGYIEEYIHIDNLEIHEDYQLDCETLNDDRYHKIIAVDYNGRCMISHFEYGGHYTYSFGNVEELLECI